MGGLTQIGRTASVTFEDGTVMTLTESANDLDILKKRRMHGWNAHEYKNPFILADGEEIDMADFQPAALESGEELSAGDRLLLATNTTDMPEESLLGSSRRKAVLAALQADGKAQDVASEVDGKDRVVTDLIDGKDRVYLDPKDGKDAKDVFQQPVFALTADQSMMADERLDMILMGNGFGGGSDWGSMRTPLGGVGATTGPGSSISVGTPGTPPIGAAIPEPSALWWMGIAGATGLAYKAWRRRLVAA